MTARMPGPLSHTEVVLGPIFGPFGMLMTLWMRIDVLKPFR